MIGGAASESPTNTQLAIGTSSIQVQSISIADAPCLRKFLSKSVDNVRGGPYGLQRGNDGPKGAMNLPLLQYYKSITSFAQRGWRHMCGQRVILARYSPKLLPCILAISRSKPDGCLKPSEPANVPAPHGLPKRTINVRDTKK